MLASSGANYLIRLWDVETRQLVRTIKGSTSHTITSLAFSPDGKLLASASPDGTVRLWAVETGKEVRRWGDDEATPTVTVRFSADGKTLATGDLGAKLYLWDISTGKQKRRSGPARGRVEETTFAPDLQLAAQTSGGDLWVTDTASGKTPHSFESDHRNYWDNYWDYADFSPDSGVLALAASHSVTLFDLLRKRKMWQFDTPIDLGKSGRHLPRRVAFSPDGKVLATANEADDSRSMGLLEVATGRLLLRFESHPKHISCLAFSPDGGQLVSGGEDKKILVRDVRGLLLKDHPLKAELSPAELKACWDDLGAEDALRAYRSVYRLAATGKQAVTFLRTQLKPVTPRDEQIARLLIDLEDKQFKVREKALRELVELDDLAIPLLRKSLEQKPTLELRRRITELLERMDHPALTGRQARAGRATAVLEQIGSAEARDVLRQIARGVAQSRLTKEAKASLKRLDARSKHAVP